MISEGSCDTEDSAF